MKIQRVVLFLIIVLSLPVIAAAQEIAEKGEQGAAVEKKIDHSGFFFRIVAGGGTGDIILEEPPLDDDDWQAFYYNVQLQGGWGVRRHWPVYLVYGVQLSTEMANLQLGLGSSYYVMPLNIYVDLQGGISEASFMRFNNTTYESGRGFFSQLSVGKEFRVSDNWGLGVAAYVMYSKNPKADSLETDQFDSGPLQMYTFGLAMTATYF